MFGLSLGKILFTVALVVIAWRVLSMIARKRAGNTLRESRADRVRRTAEDITRARAGSAQFRSEPPPDAVDMVRCPSCGNWIAPGTTCNCGYKDAR